MTAFQQDMTNNIMCTLPANKPFTKRLTDRQLFYKKTVTICERFFKCYEDLAVDIECECLEKSEMLRSLRENVKIVKIWENAVEMKNSDFWFHFYTSRIEGTPKVHRKFNDD